MISNNVPQFQFCKDLLVLKTVEISIVFVKTFPGEWKFQLARYSAVQCSGKWYGPSTSLSPLENTAPFSCSHLGRLQTEHTDKGSACKKIYHSTAVKDMH